MTALDDIGAVHRGFVYASPSVAKRAWEEAERAVGRKQNLSLFRSASPTDLQRQFVVVMGELADQQEIDRIARMLELRAEGPIELPDAFVESMRERRLAKMTEMVMRGDETLNQKTRWGEQGAIFDRHGNVYPRRRSG